MVHHLYECFKLVGKTASLNQNTCLNLSVVHILARKCVLFCPFISGRSRMHGAWAQVLPLSATSSCGRGRMDSRNSIIDSANSVSTCLSLFLANLSTHACMSLYHKSTMACRCTRHFPYPKIINGWTQASCNFTFVG